MPTVAQDIVAAQPIMMLHTVFRLLGSGRPLFVLRWNCSRVVLHIGFLFGLLIGVTVVVLLFTFTGQPSCMILCGFLVEGEQSDPRLFF